MHLSFLSKYTLITALSAVSILWAEPGAEVIANGLNNPRGIAISPDGDLYVAEAGTGGTGACIPTSDGTSPCFGTTGSITRIDLRKKTQERVVTGLPSLAAPDGSEALGPHGISFQGKGNGFITLGLASNPALRGALGPLGATMASEARVSPNGSWTPTANIGNFEIANNPAGGTVDSNPFGITAIAGKQIIADAGGNDLLEVSANGDVRLLAVFPAQLALAPPFLGLPPGTRIPAQAVPTTVVQGPDGAYYVGQLTGFPFEPGLAKVYRVPAEGGTPTVAFSGFTNIISIAFGPDGALYVLQISKNGLLGGNPQGALYKVLNGVKTELAAGQLFLPGGMAIANDGTIYVTNWAVLAGGGQVLRITQ